MTLILWALSDWPDKTRIGLELSSFVPTPGAFHGLFPDFLVDFPVANG